MSSPGVTIRLQGLPVTASSADIRKFFSGLNIPDGGVHIIGGENGEAFISFSSDEDGRLGMLRNNAELSGSKIMLYLSSKSQMQSVIDELRGNANAPPVPFSSAGGQMPQPNFFPNPVPGFPPYNQQYNAPNTGMFTQPASNSMNAPTGAPSQVPANSGVPWGQPQTPSNFFGQQNQNIVQPSSQSGFPPNQNFRGNERPTNDNRGSFNSGPSSGNFAPNSGGPLSGNFAPNSGGPSSGNFAPNSGGPSSGNFAPNSGGPSSGNFAPNSGGPNFAASSIQQPHGYGNRSDTNSFDKNQSDRRDQNQNQNQFSDRSSSGADRDAGRGDFNYSSYNRSSADSRPMPDGGSSNSGVSVRGDTDFFRGPVDNRGGHSIRGNFAGRGGDIAPRGDFSSRGDFSTRGDFSSRGDFPRGRGNDFSGRGRSDFQVPGRGSFPGRGDFSGRGDNSMRGQFNRGTFDRPNATSTGYSDKTNDSNRFSAVPGNPSIDLSNQSGGLPQPVQNVPVIPNFDANRGGFADRGRGEFGRGRGASERGSFFPNRGTFDSTRGSSRGSAASFDNAAPWNRGRGENRGRGRGFEASPGQSFDSNRGGRGGHSEVQPIDTRVNIPSTSPVKVGDFRGGFNGSGSLRQPSRDLERPRSDREEPVPSRDLHDSRNRDSRDRDFDSRDRKQDYRSDSRSNDDKYSGGRSLAPPPPSNERRLGDKSSFDRERSTLGYDSHSRSDSRSYNERKRSGSRDVSESYNKRQMLDKPQRVSYCLIEGAPLSVTSSDVDQFIAQKSCRPLVKPIILTRQKFCLVYLKFSDESQSERCSQLNGKFMRSAKVFISVANADDFNKANVEFQTQINKEIFQRAKVDNYKGFFLELSGLPADVSSEDVSDIIGGIPLQVDDLYVEYNRHGLFIEPNIAYVRLIGQPDVNRAVRYSGESWKGRKITISSILSSVHYQKLKSHFYAVYETSSSSRQYKEDVRPSSSDSRKRISPANSSDSRKSRADESTSSRARTPPKDKKCPDNVCVELMNLPSGTEKRDVREFFRKMKVMHVIFEGEAKGKAYVEFEKEREQIAALRMNNQSLKGNEIKILAFDSKDYLKIYNLSKQDKKNETPPEKSSRVDIGLKDLPSRSQQSSSAPSRMDTAPKDQPSRSQQSSFAPSRMDTAPKDQPSRSQQSSFAPSRMDTAPKDQPSRYQQLSSSGQPSSRPVDQRPVAEVNPQGTMGFFCLIFARPTRVNLDFLRKFLQISPSVELQLKIAPGPYSLCEQVLFKTSEKPIDHFLSLNGKSFVGIVVTMNLVDGSQFNQLVVNLNKTPLSANPQSTPTSNTPPSTTPRFSNNSKVLKPPIVLSTKKHYSVKFTKPLNLKVDDLKGFLKLSPESRVTTKPNSMQTPELISEVFICTSESPQNPLMAFMNRWFCQVQLTVKLLSESDYEIEQAVLSKMNDQAQKPHVSNEPLDKCMAKLTQLPNDVTEKEILDFLADISTRKNGICIFTDISEAIVFFETSTDREKALRKHNTSLGKNTIRVENCYLTEAMSRVPQQQFNPIALVGFPDVTDNHTITMAENIPKDCDAKQLQELLKPIKIAGITFMRSCSIAFVLLSCSVDVQLSQLKSNNFIGSHKVKLTPKTKEEMNQIIEEFKRESGELAAREAAASAAAAQEATRNTTQIKSPGINSRLPPFPTTPIRVQTTPEFAVHVQNIPVTVIKKDIIDFFQDVTTITEDRIFIKANETEKVSEALVILSTLSDSKVASEHNNNYIGPNRVSVKSLNKDEVSKQLSIFGAIISPATLHSGKTPTNSTGFDPITLRVTGLPIDVKPAEVLQFFQEFEPNPSYLTLNCDPITRACTAQLVFDNRQRGLAAMKDRQGKFLSGRKIVITTM